MPKYAFVEAKRLQDPLFLAQLWPLFREWVTVAFDAEMHHVLAEWSQTEWSREELTGLCVADKHPYAHTAILQSLSGQDLPTLLSHMESYLRRLHTTSISVEWERERRLEEVFQERGWKRENKPFESYYFYMPDFNPSWFNPNAPLAAGFEAIPWAAITPEEAEQLTRWGSQDGYLLSGEDEIYPRDETCSLILRKGKQIAGWIETHQIHPQMIRYTSLFLFPEFQQKGLAIPFLSRSLERHKLSSIPIAHFCLNLNETPLSWQNFVAKRLAPHAFHHKETLTSIKLLN